MQNDPSSVRILKSTAKVSPEPVTSTLVSEPELATRCVFGVNLETLREDGQMVYGIPLVLREMVEFLDNNGNFSVTPLLFIYHFYHTPPSFLFTPLCLCLTLSMQNNTPTGMHHRGLFRLCGSVVRTRQLRQQWDSGERVDLEQEGDVPTVSSLLKLFLRELPTPVVPEPQRKQLVLSLTGTKKAR